MLRFVHKKNLIPLHCLLRRTCNQLVETKLLKQILKQAKRKFFRISGKADKFVNDLNAELRWTSSGQTNRLLGRITMRSYIFHHVLSGSKPLVGTALIEDIVETARSPAIKNGVNINTRLTIALKNGPSASRAVTTFTTVTPTASSKQSLRN